jgi:phospholipid-transporting ATPase
LPNPRLYNFNGSLELLAGNTASSIGLLSLEAKQTLLRGAMLRNTEWVFGVAVYTGHDTKLMKNASEAPVKRTNVERLVNYQIVFMFCLLFVLAIISSVGYALWQSRYSASAWYLEFPSNAAASAALSFITFIILYNNLIPISLYVSVEMVKFGQAYFINHDVEMYDPQSDTPALARTSNLNEELGQVQYIFSDKTGTISVKVMCQVLNQSSQEL